jgi:hypothetical protein
LNIILGTGTPNGKITIGGTDTVASFGPSIVTSITVKNGLIVAIS